MKESCVMDNSLTVDYFLCAIFMVSIMCGYLITSLLFKINENIQKQSESNNCNLIDIEQALQKMNKEKF